MGPGGSSAEVSAYHEAGHAVFAWRYGNPILERGVSIDGAGGGFCHTRMRIYPGERWTVEAAPVSCRDAVRRNYRWRAEAQVAESLAGEAAEQRFLGKLRRPVSGDRLIAAAREIGRSGVSDYIVEHGMLDDIAMIAIALGECIAPAPGSRAVRGQDAATIVPVVRSIERRVRRALPHPRTWAAITDLAIVLLETGHLPADQAEAIIARRTPPRVRCPGV